MDWTVYWFQSIACFAFASVAMFSGISGAALMVPWFVMGFAVIGVPEITTQQAIAASLFLESAAFSIGIYSYWRRGFIHWQTVKKLIGPVIPAAVIGALLAHRAPEIALHLVYSSMMLAAAGLLFKRIREEQAAVKSEGSAAPAQTEIRLRGVNLQRTISGVGALMTGLISTGIGEVTQPSLIVRSRFPVPVAAATSIVLVAVADFGAILTHFTQFVSNQGIGAIPWNLIVWGVPGMAAGASFGSWLQGRVNEHLARKFFVGLFVVLAITFLVSTIAGTLN